MRVEIAGYVSIRCLPRLDLDYRPFIITFCIMAVKLSLRFRCFQLVMKFKRDLLTDLCLGCLLLSSELHLHLINAALYKFSSVKDRILLKFGCPEVLLAEVDASSYHSSAYRLLGREERQGNLHSHLRHVDVQRWKYQVKSYQQSEKDPKFSKLLH